MIWYNWFQEMCANASTSVQSRSISTDDGEIHKTAHSYVKSRVLTEFQHKYKTISIGQLLFD